MKDNLPNICVCVYIFLISERGDTFERVECPENVHRMMYLQFSKNENKPKNISKDKH